MVSVDPRQMIRLKKIIDHNQSFYVYERYGMKINLDGTRGKIIISSNSINVLILANQKKNTNMTSTVWNFISNSDITSLFHNLCHCTETTHQPAIVEIEPSTASSLILTVQLGSDVTLIENCQSFQLLVKDIV